MNAKQEPAALKSMILSARENINLVNGDNDSRQDPGLSMIKACQTDKSKSDGITREPPISLDGAQERMHKGES